MLVLCIRWLADEKNKNAFQVYLSMIHVGEIQIYSL